MILSQDSELAGVGDLGVLLVRHLLRALGQQVRVAAARRVHVAPFDSNLRLTGAVSENFANDRISRVVWCT